MASVLVKHEDKLRLYNKGAAEWVLRRCVSLHNQYGEVVPMTEELREELMQVVTAMASRGLRCICLTYTDYPEVDDSRAEGGLSWGHPLCTLMSRLVHCASWSSQAAAAGTFGRDCLGLGGA
jgi:hypothetical protein